MTLFEIANPISFWSSSISTISSSFYSPSSFSPSFSAPSCSFGFSAPFSRLDPARSPSGDLLGVWVSYTSEIGTFLVGTRILTTAFSLVFGSITVSTSRPSGKPSLGGSFSMTIFFSTSTPFGMEASLILEISYSHL